MARFRAGRIAVTQHITGPSAHECRTRARGRRKVMPTRHGFWRAARLDQGRDRGSPGRFMDGRPWVRSVRGLPRGSGAAAPSGALRAIDPSARPRSWRTYAWGAETGSWPLSCEFADGRARYCDGSATPPQRSPGAVEAGLLDAVSLHPAAGAPRPRRRRQRLGDLGAAPPARGAAPPDPASQAGARRSSAARRRQPGAAPRPLVVLLRAARDVAPLASAPGRRRVDLPTPDRPATAELGGAAADRPPGQGEPALGLPAHPRRAAAPGRPGLGRDPHDAAASRAGPGTAANGHDVAGVPAPAGRRDRRLRPASPSIRCGCDGCTYCSS
jgi:hypothetical protein